MAQTIFYDISDPAASDELGGGGGIAVSGTLASMTLGTNSMELGTTVDFTGQTLNQPVWFEAIQGERHLFEVSGFFPSASACTRLDLLEGPDSTQSNKKWGLGGKRKTFQGDVLHTDIDSAGNGWSYNIFGGSANLQYPMTATINFPGIGDPTNGGISLLGSGTSRPKISWVGDMNGFDLSSASVFISNIDLEITGSAPNSKVLVSTSNQYKVSLEHCNITAPNRAVDLVLGTFISFDCNYTSSPTTGNIFNLNSPDSCVIVGGVISGTLQSGTEGAFIGTGNSNHICILGTVISTSGSVFTKGLSITFSGSRSSTTIKNCTITHSSLRQGSCLNIWNLPGPGVKLIFINNIIANATFGIERAGGATNPNESMNVLNDYNAYYNITVGEMNAGIGKGPNSITVPSDPFVDAANGNFALNNVADGGALLKTSGFGF